VSASEYNCYAAIGKAERKRRKSVGSKPSPYSLVEKVVGESQTDMLTGLREELKFQKAAGRKEESGEIQRPNSGT